MVLHVVVLGQTLVQVTGDAGCSVAVLLRAREKDYSHELPDYLSPVR